MTAASVPLLRKEVRGLLAMWLVCLAAIALTAAVGRGLEVIGVAMYALGAVVIGALSIGQEYNSRTLTLLLSQPVERGRLLMLKAGVLAAMLAVLAAVAREGLSPLFADRLGTIDAHDWQTLTLVLPLFAGLFLAPCLTMVCGSPLAGAVFALAIPGAMWVAGDLTAAVIYGGELSQTAGAKALSQDIFWRGTMLASLTAAIGGWWLFTRLEAIDHRGFDVQLPAWFSRHERRTAGAAAPPVKRRHAVWFLAVKELHLQQLTFAISALYVGSWIVLLLFTPVAVKTRATVLYVISLLHAGAIPLLAGSLASAEERQLGVLGWQTLLPIAAWKPWAVKASVALSLTLGLVFGVPALMSRLPASAALIAGELSSPITWSYVVALMAVAVSSLYVGSLCTNGLRALLISMPVALAVLQFALLGYRRSYRMFAESLRLLLSRPGPLHRALLYELLAQAVWVAGSLAAVALLLRFGLTNHRSEERAGGRAAKQVAVVAAVLVLITLSASGLSVVARAEYRRLDQLAGRVRVSGVVLDAQRQPVTKYTVVIFGDAGREFWSDRFGRGVWVRSDKHGEFELYQVPAGRYSVVAVPEVKDKVRGDSGLVERLKALATPIDIAPGEPNHLTLTLSAF